MTTTHPAGGSMTTDGQDNPANTEAMQATVDTANAVAQARSEQACIVEGCAQPRLHGHAIVHLNDPDPSDQRDAIARLQGRPTRERAGEAQDGRTTAEWAETAREFENAYVGEREQRIAAEAECDQWKQSALHGEGQRQDLALELGEHDTEWRHVGACEGCTYVDPEETCPMHGRTLIEWRDIANERAGRANAAEAERDEARAEVERLHETLWPDDMFRRTLDRAEAAEAVIARVDELAGALITEAAAEHACYRIYDGCETCESGDVAVKFRTALADPEPTQVQQASEAMDPCPCGESECECHTYGPTP